MFFRSFISIARLIFLFLVFLILYPILRKKSIYLFLNHAGPSFIKLGQALSTRPDLVGIDMAKTLSTFQDKMDPFSTKTVKEILVRQYGHDYETATFKNFDYNPKACASIAQVHKATLNNGNEVAVKILRPYVAKTVRRDLAALNFLIKIIALFSSHLAGGLKDLSTMLSRSYETELDLNREASNAIRLKHNMKDEVGFYVPHIYTHLTSSRIMVSEWINGIPFSDHKAILESKHDKKKLAKNLVVNHFNQSYRDGFFHADSHHGNLFLMENGDIAAVDFGIMGDIDKKLRIAVAEILIGYLNRDYKRVAQIHIDAGLVPKDVDFYGLELSCSKIGNRMVDVSIKNISLAGLMTDLIEMTSKYNMTTRPELLLLQKTIILVEGVGVMLDPDLNIWTIAKPWVKDWAVKNISFDAKIRDAVVDFFTAMKNIIKDNI